MSTELIVAILGALGAGTFLPSIIKGLFGRPNQREALIHSREQHVADWEVGFREELRREAAQRKLESEECAKSNAILIAQMAGMREEITELKDEIIVLTNKLNRL
jgi:hypothetical protein